MADKIGIIDLGSNTFHLLIVSVNSKGSFDIIHKERSYVGLAGKGIEYIDPKAIEKGLNVLTKFKSDLDKFKVNNFKIIGTSALRSAKNSAEFINEAKKKIGVDIEVIDGNREADLIYKGVRLLHEMNGNYIIMDIGGGSVEFIFVKEGKNQWSKSYNIGVGVLFNEFHKTDPISIYEKKKLSDFLSNTIFELKSLSKDLKIDALIGASGSFEVVESMNGITTSSSKLSEVTIEDYKEVSSKLIKASFEERCKMQGLPESRRKLIVVAMILIDEVIEMFDPAKILISPYALKEGILSELIA